jgi:hypothetical protein
MAALTEEDRGRKKRESEQSANTAEKERRNKKEGKEDCPLSTARVPPRPHDRVGGIGS